MITALFAVIAIVSLILAARYSCHYSRCRRAAVVALVEQRKIDFFRQSVIYV